MWCLLAGAASCASTVTDTAGRAAGPDAAPVDVARVDAAALDLGTPDRADAGERPTFCDVVPANVPLGPNAPRGFCIRRFARVAMPRVLAFAPNGDLFVSSPGLPSQGGTGPGLGAIVVLADDDRDGLADAPVRFLDGLPSVHGIAFDGDSLLYSVERGVYRAPYVTGDRRARGDVAPVADLGDSSRWTHTVARSPSGELFVTMGQYDRTNCDQRDARAGSVLRIGNGAPSAGAVVVGGLRNPLYARCEPWGTCYAMELTHDSWDVYDGREKLVEVRAGDDFHDPCCVDRLQPVPGAMDDCAGVPDALLRIAKHDTPLGFDWAPPNWPPPYAGAFFVAQHGAFGTWDRAGLFWAYTDPTTHRPTSAVTPFLAGWGAGQPVAGRPADVVFAPDGRLFFADDQDGAVYWVAPLDLPLPG